MNLKTFKVCLRELERAQTDGHTDRQTNRTHEHFSTLLESVLLRNRLTLLKINIRPFRNIAHNMSEIFCVILYMKHAIVQLKEIC